MSTLDVLGTVRQNTKKPYRLFVDQFGNKFWARTVRELRTEVGGGSVSKMYVDKEDGRTYHVGYVIGTYWLTEYAVRERQA